MLTYGSEDCKVCKRDKAEPGIINEICEEKGRLYLCGL